MPASYFLGNQLLGTTIRNPKWSDTEEMDFNEALFCQVCGDIWGRVIRHRDLPWHTTNRACARLHSKWDAAGSFIAPWRTTFEELPPEVLRYEAILRLDRFEKEMEHERS